MRQIALALDDLDYELPRLELGPDQEQRLVAVMADAILAVMQSAREQQDDER